VSISPRSRLGIVAAAGIHRTVNVEHEVLAVRQEAREGADVVVDCVGTELDAALDLVRTGGRISLFGMNSRARPAVRQTTITRNELTIFGSYVGVNTFSSGDRVVGTPGDSALGPLVCCAPLEAIHEAIAALKGGMAMKVAIRHHAM
jgi:threonine dehydrogenase-like Zn-dependent dehydrogenase